MKNQAYKTDYTAKKFNELSENEVNELITICVFSAKEKMLRMFSNVPMIDKILIEEKNDLISQTWIYAYAKSEKQVEENAFSICYKSALASYRKLINERLGKRKRETINGKQVMTGRYTETSVEENSVTMKTKTEKSYDSSNYIDLKIDIDRRLTEEEKTIIEYRKEGYTLREIAIIKKTNAMNIQRKVKDIQKKLKDYR